jgi:hypothetical protein
MTCPTWCRAVNAGSITVRGAPVCGAVQVDVVERLREVEYAGLRRVPDVRPGWDAVRAVGAKEPVFAH